MLTFHTTSVRRFGRKHLSILEIVITATRLEKLDFLKGVLRERFFNFQPKIMLVAQSMNARCFFIVKWLIVPLPLVLV